MTLIRLRGNVRFGQSSRLACRSGLFRARHARVVRVRFLVRSYTALDVRLWIDLFSIRKPQFEVQMGPRAVAGVPFYTDLLASGNLLEFSVPLQRRSHSGELS